MTAFSDTPADPASYLPAPPAAVLDPTPLDRIVQCLESITEALADVATTFSCSEAEWIADAYRAAGHPGFADEFLHDHAAGDEEGDAHYPNDQKGNPDDPAV